MTGRGPWGICDRSGFKVRQSDMVTEWNGARVAKRYAERRHPQDMPAHPRVSPPIREARPEPEDVFLSPGDVTQADL